MKIFHGCRKENIADKDDRENLSKQHTVTGLSSNFNFGILKK